MKLNSKSINYNVQTVDELVSLDGLEGDTVVVTDEDRGGVFVYREANALVNNGGTIFNGWTRQYDGAVNVKWFGAKDGEDGALAIQKAILASDEIYLPKETYYLDSSIIFLDGYVGSNSIHNKRIFGEATLIKRNPKTMISMYGSTNITFDGITFDGNIEWDEVTHGAWYNNDGTIGTRLSTNYSCGIFAGLSNSKITITNCKFLGFAQDALNIKGTINIDGINYDSLSSDVVVENNEFHNCRNSMLLLYGVERAVVKGNYGHTDVDFYQRGNFVFCVETCNSITIDSNRGYNIGDNAYALGNFAGTEAIEKINRNIIISNNYCDGSRYHTILVAGGKDVTIENNLLINCGIKEDMFPNLPSSVNTAGIALHCSSVLQGIQSNILVRNNKIFKALERGIFAFDRPDAVAANLCSVNIKAINNFVAGSGMRATTQPLYGTGGIEFRFAINNGNEIKGNYVSYSRGFGISVYGSVDVLENTVRATKAYGTINGYGINYYDDTLFSTVGDIKVIGNTVEDSEGTGISIWNKNNVILNSNKVYRNGKAVTKGGSLFDQYKHNSGVYLKSCIYTTADSNILKSNNGAGISSQSSTYLNVTNSLFDGNGVDNTLQNAAKASIGHDQGTIELNCSSCNFKAPAVGTSTRPIYLSLSTNSYAVGCTFGAYDTASSNVVIANWFNWATLTATATVDPVSLLANTGTTHSITVTGAMLGDYAQASFSLDLQDITLSAYVVSANTVEVRFFNGTAGTIDLASGTLKVKVTK